MELNVLYKEDCFELIKEIPDNSIDCICTDPPYLISRDSNYHKISSTTSESLIKKFGKYKIDFGEFDNIQYNWLELFTQYYRILKKGGTIIWFFDCFKMETIKNIAESCKFKQARLNIWIKTNPVPINSKLNYLTNAKEYFITFVKGSKPTFNSKYDNGVYYYPIEHGKERTKHPTQKPLRLMEELILKHTNENDIVLDNFAGSGTTLKACGIHKRNFIGCESNDEFYEIAKNRLKDFLVGT